MNIGLTFARWTETQPQMYVNVAPCFKREQRHEKERLLTLTVVMGTLKIHLFFIKISLDGISWYESPFRFFHCSGEWFPLGTCEKQRLGGMLMLSPEMEREDKHRPSFKVDKSDSLWLAAPDSKSLLRFMTVRQWGKEERAPMGPKLSKPS